MIHQGAAITGLTPNICVHTNKFPKNIFPLTIGRGHIWYKKLGLVTIAIADLAQ